MCRAAPSQDWSDDSRGLCWYLGIFLKGALLQTHTDKDTHSKEALLHCVGPAAVTERAYTVTWVQF